MRRAIFVTLLLALVLPATAAAATVLDAGPGDEQFSLAVAGRRLYWMRDGLPRSAAD